MRRWAALIAATAAAGITLTAPAQAADGGLAISYVEPTDSGVELLLSVPEGAEVDLAGIEVMIAGEAATATAELAGTSETVVERTTVLAIDTSNSMKRQGRFDAAKLAATTFLDTVPEDVSVGIVTFDSEVETVLAPTQDRSEAKAVLDSLELALKTRLHDGVIEAVAVAGDAGQRTILVLSDGRDTSDTPAEDVTAAITDSEVQVNVVALDQSGAALVPLEAMATAGAGSVISADPESLTTAFEAEASSLARQVQVSAQLPAGVTDSEATVEVSVPAGGSTLTASTFSVIQDSSPALPTIDKAIESGLQIPKVAMYGGIGALGLGVLVLSVGLLWNVGKPATVEDRIAAYGATPTGKSGKSESQSLSLDQAKDAAASMLHRNRDLETRIATRLEAAGSGLKPSEWLLTHAAITIVAGLVGMLIGGGSAVTVLLFLAGGAVLPWLWLGRKRRKRVKAFNSGLADTLQLIGGSLSAGMSLAQSLDTVVREGGEPISGEFKRVLVETRLGVGVEDALDGVAERMGSKDFSWVVMAIRIQREVGGNLAELLGSVAATLRERDYLRRQVQTLSAEGKLSGYILGGLPPAMMVYMLIVRPNYIAPLFSEPMGWLFLGMAAFLLTFGAFIMSRIVKVEV